MHWIFKVVFILLCYTVSSSCRPLSQQLNSKQKRFNLAPSNNITKELFKKVQSTSNHNSNHRQPPLQVSGSRQRGYFENNHGRILPSKFYDKNELKRRGLDVGILVNFPTTRQYDTDLEKLESMLANALANRLGVEKYNKTEDCPSCEEEEEVIIKRIIKPAYECDEWEPVHRVCILERNIGDTVTFYLSTGQDEGKHQFNVTWRKEFHMRDSKERKEFIIDHQNPPENIIIGRRGFELRVSPITETDMAYNMFSATLQTHASVKSKLYFMIRIVPIDLGFVYVGETIDLNLRKFVSLPEQSMSYKWYMEKDGEHGTLPSNMKVSITGSSIKISELRQEQEGILACSVYTNLQILATKKRFLIKDLIKNKDVLQSSPNHTLIFREEFRKKRDPKKFLPFLSSFRLSRQKRARLAAEEVERALLQSTGSEIEIPSYTTNSPRYNDYNPYIESQHFEPQSFEDNENKFQEISDNIDEVRDFPSNRKVDLPVKQESAIVEEPVVRQRVLGRPQPINEELALQAGVPVEEMNFPDSRPVLNQPENLQINAVRDRSYMNKPQNGLIRMPEQYLENKIPHENVADLRQKGSVVDISVNPLNLQQQQDIQLTAEQKQRQNGMQYIDLDVETKGRKPNQQVGYSDIVLNIGGIKESRQITAEVLIAKLISHCFNDFQCSVTATCVRTSLKIPGYCKCLPGSSGVGIFCREEVWLSNSNFDIEEHELDYMGYQDTSSPV